MAWRTRLHISNRAAGASLVHKEAEQRAYTTLRDPLLLDRLKTARGAEGLARSDLSLDARHAQ